MKTREWEKYEMDADTILDELINEANKDDTNVSAATTTEVSSESVPQSDPTSSLMDIQALIAKAVWEKKNILGLGFKTFRHWE
nr:hypothetical protein [Tanacetum cinerariifolium]